MNLLTENNLIIEPTCVVDDSKLLQYTIYGFVLLVLYFETADKYSH